MYISLVIPLLGKAAAHVRHLSYKLPSGGITSNMVKKFINKEYNQQNGESLKDWKARILKQKANGEMLEAWDNLAYVFNCSREELESEAFSLIENDIINSSIESENTILCEDGEISLAELQHKERVLDYKKAVAAEHIAEEKRLLRCNANKSALEALIKEAIIAGGNLPEIKFEYKEDTNADNAGILCCSDWHVGLVTTNIHNQYNDLIMLKRVKELTERSIEYGKLNKINQMNVLLLGDIINGNIHIQNRITNSIDIVSQTINATEVISQMLIELRKNFNEVRVFWTRGNHDRMTANLKESMDNENYMDLVWYMLKAKSINTDIKFIDNEYSNDMIISDINGYEIVATHGQYDRVNANTVTKINSYVPKDINKHRILVMGHYHSPLEREEFDTEFLVNGSLVGTDDYANKKRLYSEPSQKFFIINKDRGRTATYNIKFSA